MQPLRFGTQYFIKGNTPQDSERIAYYVAGILSGYPLSQTPSFRPVSQITPSSPDKLIKGDFCIQTNASSAERELNALESTFYQTSPPPYGLTANTEKALAHITKLHYDTTNPRQIYPDGITLDFTA